MPRQSGYAGCKMDTPHGVDISSNRSVPGRSRGPPGSPDGLTRFALVFIAFGWFFMQTLVVTIGSLQHGVRFFDMTAVIADPTRLFFNVDTSLQRVGFGVICFVCLLTPVIAAIRNSRAAWAFYFAPLVLMLVCGAVLYSKTSAEFFATPSTARGVGGDFLHLANDLARHGSDLVSRHITVGAGGYWGFIGCVLLAVQGVRQFHRR